LYASFHKASDVPRSKGTRLGLVARLDVEGFDVVVVGGGAVDVGGEAITARVFWLEVTGNMFSSTCLRGEATALPVLRLAFLVFLLQPSTKSSNLLIVPRSKPSEGRDELWTTRMVNTEESRDN
jgi:hypothetical protein